MKIIISFKFKGKADRWFRSKSEYTKMMLDELLTAMKDAFDQGPSKADCIRKVEMRTWQPNETFNNYYHEKLIMGNFVPIEGDDLLDYLVDGIPDQTLRNQARMQNFNSVKDLLNGFHKISLGIGPSRETLKTKRNQQRRSPLTNRNRKRKHRRWRRKKELVKGRLDVTIVTNPDTSRRIARSHSENEDLVSTAAR